MDNIPILIPVKTVSVRCPNKNKILLPYTLDYVRKQGLEKNIVVIADSDEFLPIVKDYSINEYYVENRQDDSDEMLSINNYLKDKPIHDCIWLPSTQPCRSDNLLSDVIAYGITNYDMVTSFVKRQNRKIFEINKDKKNFVIKDIERKGSLCEDEFIADGAIYYITKNFIKKVCDSNNRNYYFWNSKIGFVENHSPFVDIDTKNDMDLLLKYYRLNF